jgi:hypothetical protein
MEQEAREAYRCHVCGSNGVVFNGPGGREFVCVSCTERTALDQCLDDAPLASLGPRPLCSDDSGLEWFLTSLDREKWWCAGKQVFASEAALLLCGRNPDWAGRTNGTRDPFADVVDISMTDVYARLLKFFDRLETAEPSLRLTLAQWRDRAREAGIEYDVRVDDLLPPVTDSSSATQGPVGRPQLISQQQEMAILEAIVRLGHDPTALPQGVNGKAGVKAAVRTELPYSTKVFDKAWERLRNDKRVQYA